MEAGGKDCEEETLQTAFKKLRVDAESLPGAVSVSEALTSRACLDTGVGSGGKPKLSCPKDNWHGCMRKTSRGASRTQRRRRSKSPILHPPKFTYCSTAAATSVCLKQQRLAVPDPVESLPAVDGGTAVTAQKELSSSATSSHSSPLVFGSCAGYETHVGGVASPPSLQEIPSVVTTAAQDGGSSSEESGPEKSACEGAESSAAAAAPGLSRPGDAADFRALSETPSVHCSCGLKNGSDSPEESSQGAEPQCRCGGWQGVEVYSFTGLRNVISECERNLPSQGDATRTLSSDATAASASASASALTSGSPRSCSEQARAYVDDITIEDLSGYMEYYLYIPKKMSHMAEMMYT